MPRERIVQRSEITALGFQNTRFKIEISEPYAQGRQNRENPKSRYTARVFRLPTTFYPIATYTDLTPQEAFKDLPTSIFEKWGYDKFSYIHTLQRCGVYGYSKHPYQLRKEAKTREAKAH